MKKEIEVNAANIADIEKQAKNAAGKGSKAKPKKNEPETDEAKMLKEKEKKLIKSVNSKKQIIVEHYGKQVSEDQIAERLVEKLKLDGFEEAIKSLSIYYKVEEETAYCVVNDSDPVVINLN